MMQQWATQQMTYAFANMLRLDNLSTIPRDVGVLPLDELCEFRRGNVLADAVGRTQ